MKTRTRITILLIFIFWSFPPCIAQDIRIKQSDLPYSIPIVEYASQGDKVEYRWLENNEYIENANDSNYIIPQSKEIGFYTFIHQVKCIECDDWLDSNRFTVEIYATEELSDLNDAFRVKFSPQQELSGYLEDLTQLIDESKQQLDIAIYSLDSYDIHLALMRAVARGVQIRMLYEGALKDRNESEGTTSHSLEEIGVDVKYVNKTNHNKFVISDRIFLMTSSGNWNSKANWRYEDSTLSITDAAVVMRYRAEFELLWNNSREFGKRYTYSIIKPDSLLATITSTNQDVDVLFTSSNYRISHSAIHGPTFSKTENRQYLADRIVHQINQSKKSIKIAANYLRSRPINEALMSKKRENPQIEISVFTDQNEYITAGYNDYQLAQRQQCLETATTPAKIRDCLEKNFLYSYELQLAGIDVRFKTYSYKWHYTTASTMHHKFAVFDDEVIAVGSYNYSYNSETNCMENLIVFNNKAAPIAVEKYISNFNAIWELGRNANYYADLLSLINSGARYVPLIYNPIALTHGEYTALKDRIERACPAVKHEYFRKKGQLYTSYLKGVALKYNWGNTVVRELTEYFDENFILNYEYDTRYNLTALKFQSSDSIVSKNEYKYTDDNKLIQAVTPYFKVDLTYRNNQLNSLNSGQGDHRWFYQSLPDNEMRISYHKPTIANHLVSTWTNFGFPMQLSDPEGRTIEWTYDRNRDLNRVLAASRSTQYVNTKNTLFATTSDGNQYDLKLYSLDKYVVNTTGTLESTVSYQTKKHSEKEYSLDIDVFSNNVRTGKGRVASINYLFDAYGRVVKAGNLQLIRKAFSGEITEIKIGNLKETRRYDLWGLLTHQWVNHGDDQMYKVHYHYDGFHRINQVDEELRGVSTQYLYVYNTKGQLDQVVKNGAIAERYFYDDFGNRIRGILGTNTYDFTNNTRNQTVSMTYNGQDDRKEFYYNSAGQLSKVHFNTANSVGQDIQYDYDVYGNLQKVDFGSSYVTYEYDAFKRPIALFEDGVLKRKFLYGSGDSPLALLNNQDRIVNTFIYTAKNEPILMREGSVDNYLVSDIRGSIRMAIDVHSGEVQQQLDYDAFGRVVVDTNPAFTPFGYAGGFYDYKTNLLRLGNRDYLAEIGKWTTENPIGFFSGGFNDYSFVLNDPINYISVNGMDRHRVGLEKELSEFDLNRIYKGLLGPAGKGRSWYDFSIQDPSKISNLQSQTMRNLNNRIYPPTGNMAIHPKLSIYNNSKLVFYKPKHITEWVSQ